MSNPYRDHQTRQDDDPVPDFGNRFRVARESATALTLGASIGLLAWRDFHDPWLSLLLGAPPPLVVIAIVLLQELLRRSTRIRAGRHVSDR